MSKLLTQIRIMQANAISSLLPSQSGMGKVGS